MKRRLRFLALDPCGYSTSTPGPARAQIPDGSGGRTDPAVWGGDQKNGVNCGLLAGYDLQSRSESRQAGAGGPVIFDQA